MREFEIGQIEVVQVKGVWADLGHDMQYPFYSYMLFEYTLLGWSFIRGDFPFDRYQHMPAYRLKKDMQEQGYSVRRVVNPPRELIDRIGDIDTERKFKTTWQGHRKSW